MSFGIGLSYGKLCFGTFPPKRKVTKFPLSKRKDYGFGSDIGCMSQTARKYICF
jgi:hypothetical protein